MLSVTLGIYCWHNGRVGVCGKPKFGSESDIKIRTVQKFDIRARRADDFTTETACNPQF